MSRLKLAFIGPIFGVVLLGLWLFQANNMPNKTVRIGYLAVGAALPLFVAEQQGFFEMQNINVELVEFRTSNDVASAALAGRIDLIGAGATNAILDANANAGGNFRIFVLNNYVKRPGLLSTDFGIARAGLDISNISDLAGKTIAVFPGSVGEVFASVVFPKLGLDIDSANIVSMAPPQWLPSLKTGSIDAVLGAVEPFATQILNDGAGYVILDGYYAEVMPRVPASGAWFIADTLSRETEETIVNAFQQAIEFIKEEPVVARSALSQFTSISPELSRNIRLQDWSISTSSEASSSLLNLANIFHENGGISKVPTNDAWIWK